MEKLLPLLCRKFHERNRRKYKQTKERLNIQMGEQKDENYISLRIHDEGIIKLYLCQ